MAPMYHLTSPGAERLLGAMDLTRRELLAGMGGLLAAAACRAHGPAQPTPVPTRPMGDTLPVRGDFALPAGQTWLNSAFIHPMPTAAASAVRSYLETRTFHEPLAPERRLAGGPGEGGVRPPDQRQAG